MKILTFPYAYLRLRSERGWPTYVRDLPISTTLSALILMPFYFVEGSIFFSKDGFLDKFASFAGVLTGFYVAALIAISSIPAGSSDLDSKIENGRVYLKIKTGEAKRFLTRRQYVCYMFGYLAFISVFIAAISISSVSLSYGHPPKYFDIAINYFDFNRNTTVKAIRSFLIFTVSLPISHMIITTLLGLYYLTDKIYSRSPRMMINNDSDIDDSTL